MLYEGITVPGGVGQAPCAHDLNTRAVSILPLPHTSCISLCTILWKSLLGHAGAQLLYWLLTWR